MKDVTPRWHYRFDNYQRAYLLLKEVVLQDKPLNQLEKEGLVQRFEYTIELAWKTMKDYLEAENVIFEQITPRTVIRQAFESGIIKLGDTWQDALDARNKMAHTYDIKEFEKVITAIKDSYLAAFTELFEFLKPRWSYKKDG